MTTTMTREEMIDKLVEHDVDNFDIRDLADLFRYEQAGCGGRHKS